MCDSHTASADRPPPNPTRVPMGDCEPPNMAFDVYFAEYVEGVRTTRLFLTLTLSPSKSVFSYAPLELPVGAPM